jgi:imidazole glycerol-phosphate synthase subunit HisH
MRVTLFDYGAGNLHSLSKAILLSSEVELQIETDATEAVNTDALILPGVGAFSSASERLFPGRAAMRDAILSGLPCLGICLGMQLLMDKSEEGPGRGLGVIPGDVRKLKTKRVPQIGWNEIEDPSDPLFEQAPIAVGYFANSFVCKPVDESAAVAWSTHESERFVSAVRLKNTVGVQFHPEKSSGAGLRLIGAFIDSVRGRR